MGSANYDGGPKRYRKKPVVIEALRWTGNNAAAVTAFCPRAVFEAEEMMIIPTLEDGNGHQVKHVASIGDYIVKGIKGEFYPCKPDIFEESHEAVPDAADAVSTQSP